MYFLYCTYLALPFAQPANVIVGLTLLSDQQLHSAMIYGEFSGSNVMFVLWGLCLRLLQVVVMQAHHLDCDVEDVENPWWCIRKTEKPIKVLQFIVSSCQMGGSEWCGSSESGRNGFHGATIFIISHKRQMWNDFWWLNDPVLGDSGSPGQWSAGGWKKRAVIVVLREFLITLHIELDDFLVGVILNGISYI